MAQKANLTQVNKYESDRGEAKTLDLDKRARLEASEPVSALQQAPTAEHRRREGLSFWQAVKTMLK
jgi:1,2-phenylacetyl-CoA epoxidase PaaB subunit